MKTEDYSRAIRAMNDVQPDDRAVITVVLQEDGGLFVSTCGTPGDVSELLLKYSQYLDKVRESNQQ